MMPNSTNHSHIALADIHHNPWADNQPAQEPPPPRHSNDAPSRRPAQGDRRGAMNLLQRLNSGAAVEEVPTLLHEAQDLPLSSDQEKEVNTLLHDLKNSEGDAKRGVIDKAVKFLASLPEDVLNWLDKGSKDHIDSKEAKDVKDDPIHPDKPAAQPSSATHPSAPAHSEPAAPHKGGIKAQMKALHELVKERNALGKEGDMKDPETLAKAKLLDIKISQMIDDILSMAKLLAEISKRANQIAVQAV